MLRCTAPRPSRGIRQSGHLLCVPPAPAGHPVPCACGLWSGAGGVSFLSLPRLPELCQAVPQPWPACAVPSFCSWCTGLAAAGARVTATANAEGGGAITQVMQARAAPPACRRICLGCLLDSRQRTCRHQWLEPHMAAALLLVRQCSLGAVEAQLQVREREWGEGGGRMIHGRTATPRCASSAVRWGSAAAILSAAVFPLHLSPASEQRICKEWPGAWYRHCAGSA